MATQTLFLSKRIISQPTMKLSSLRRQPIDESIIREQVLSTHNYDGRHFNTNFILSIAENILSLEMGTAQEAKVEKLNQVEELNNYKQLPFHIRQLSFEIAASGLNAAENQHATIIHVLSMLSLYSWEDKLVLMLAAFSIIYGEFNLVSRLRKRKGLALKLAHLKQSTPSSDNDQKAVVDCISSVIELTRCVVELKQWPSYSPPQSPISALLPMASYWIGKSLVNTAACACGTRFKIQNELGELTALTADILATFSPELVKKKAEESFEALRYALYHNSSNKLEVFKLMFNVKDDDEIIFYNTGLSDWNDRLVLLLITSGLDIPKEQINFLKWFYIKARPHIIWIPITQNDASWTTEYEQHFETLKAEINFYWLNDPQKRVLPQFSRFVKEELFQMGWGEEPIIVSVDQRGRIVHPNVMHMILTWTPLYIEKNTIGVKGLLHNVTPFIQKELKQGSSGINRVLPQFDLMISDLVWDIDNKINAWTKDIEKMIQKAIAQSTPYDSEREKHLWQQETAWTLHLLAPQFDHYQTIGKPINDWIQKEKYIFLYGGNDIKWVREFTSKVREVGFKTQLNLELAYVGKNKTIRAIINKERMSHCPLHNSDTVWWFWTRLRSMFLSRIRYLNVSTNCFLKECNDDEILQGLKKLLAYESKNTTIEGWALLSKGSIVIVCGHGTKILRAMNDYKIWKGNIATKSFGQAFKDHHEMLVSSPSVNSHSCCTLEYPTTLRKIPENEKCPECFHRMHKFLTFSCCHGHDVDYDDDE